MHGANAASDKGAWKAAYVKETPRRVPAGVLKTTAPGQRPAATPAAATPAVATPASAWSAASATAKAAASSHTLNPAPAGHQRLRVANHGLLPYSYGMCSLRGTAAYDRSKPNLDRGVAVENLGNERHQAFFAVLDGHGAQGAAATAFVASTYPAAIIASPHWRSSTQRGAKSAAALVEAAHVTNEALLAVPDLDMSLSGTTCCAVLLRGTRLYVANVGHSRVVLARHVARVAKPGGLVLSHPSVADLPPVLAAVMRFTDLPPSACHVIDHLKAQSTRNAKRMKGVWEARGDIAVANNSQHCSLQTLLQALRWPEHCPRRKWRPSDPPHTGPWQHLLGFRPTACSMRSRQVPAGLSGSATPSKSRRWPRRHPNPSRLYTPRSCDPQLAMLSLWHPGCLHRQRTAFSSPGRLPLLHHPTWRAQSHQTLAPPPSGLHHWRRARHKTTQFTCRQGKAHAATFLSCAMTPSLLTLFLLAGCILGCRPPFDQPSRSSGTSSAS